MTIKQVTQSVELMEGIPAISTISIDDRIRIQFEKEIPKENREKIVEKVYYGLGLNEEGAAFTDPKFVWMNGGSRLIVREKFKEEGRLLLSFEGPFDDMEVNEGW